MTQKVTRKRRMRRSRTARPVELFTDLPVEKDSRGTYEAGWNEQQLDYLLCGEAELRILQQDGSIWIRVANSVDELPDRESILGDPPAAGSLYEVMGDCAVCGHAVWFCAGDEMPCGAIVHTEECLHEHAQNCITCQEKLHLHQDQKEEVAA